MGSAYDSGDVLICVEAAPNLTVGKRYPVAWNRRPDINHPTVVNDKGRPTMYAGHRFTLAAEFDALMDLAAGDIDDMPGFRD